MTDIGDVSALEVTIRKSLKVNGWALVSDFQPDNDGGIRLLELATVLGKVCVMRRDGSSLLETSCDPDAPAWEPFNRPEAIGWHNDFSTWTKRPTLSLAWIRSVPASNEGRGDWRVVNCSDVIASMETSSEGRRSLAFLRQTELPFVFAPNEPVVRFRVLESEANSKVRFYGHAIRLGLSTAPNRQASEAIEAWERNADKVGCRLTAAPGALLICDNWMSMHDRLVQAPGRSSRLVFAHAEEDSHGWGS